MSRASPVLGSAALQNPATKRLNVNESTCTQLSIFKDVMREYRKLDDTIVMRLNRSGALFRDSARSGRSSRFGDGDANTKFDSSNDMEPCLHIWWELVANWRSRTEIIDYCISVVDSELTKKEGKLNTILESSLSSSTSNSSNPAVFSPSQRQGDGWRGPSTEFYRPSQRIESTSPLTSANPEERKRVEALMSIEERQESERRQREKENDAKASLWEERVKKTQITNEKTVEAIVRRRSYEAFRSRCKFFEPPRDDKEARIWWDRVENSRSSRT